MASTYTASLRLVLPATGDLYGTWGNTLNTGLSQALEQAISGRAVIAMSDADYTLSALNGALDEARNMVLRFTGTLTANRNIVCPNPAKLYIIENATTGGFNITLKTSAGTGIAVPPATAKPLRSDGTNVVDSFSTVSSVAWSTPGTIGSTTPNTGAFTALSATSLVNTGTTTLAAALNGLAKLTAGVVSAATAGTDYQAVLVSGTNIKTINGNTLLGSGDLVIGGGGYTLPNASASVLGGIKIGAGLSIDGAGVVTASGGGGSVDGTTITDVRLKSYKEELSVQTITGATANLDLSLANVFEITLNPTTSCTFTFTNPPASGIVMSATVILIQGGTGSKLATFTGAGFTDNVNPTLTTTVGKRDVLHFFTTNGGTLWVGSHSHANV